MSFINELFNMMTSLGLGSPISRAVSFGCVGFGFQYFMKPGISYIKVGGKNGTVRYVPKEFIFTSNNKNPEAKTYLPWYSWPGLFAFIGGFIL